MHAPIILPPSAAVDSSSCRFTSDPGQVLVLPSPLPLAVHQPVAKRKRSRSGHWCWCCRRHRPNEQFSGRGHRRHLCKRCTKLGKAELEYRQGILDADRLMNQRIYRRKAVRRRALARLQDMALTHPSARVRGYVQRILRDDEIEPRPEEQQIDEPLPTHLFEELIADGTGRRLKPILRLDERAARGSSPCEDRPVTPADIHTPMAVRSPSPSH